MDDFAKIPYKSRCLAERAGFEPALGINLNTLSSHAIFSYVKPVLVVLSGTYIIIGKPVWEQFGNIEI